MSFFGADPRVARAFRRTLMASLVCMVWTAIVLMAFLLGKVSTLGMTWLAAFNLGGVALFNVAVRAGWSLRFKDVGLTQAQMVFAILSMCGAYVLVPQTRAAAVQTMCLTLVFGTFSLTASECIRAGRLLAVFPLMTVILLKAWSPGTFSMGLDGVPALGASTIMLLMSWLLSHFCRMRQTLHEQRKELKDLVAQTEKMAMTDDLTGLLNRRRMLELVAFAHARHARSVSPVCLALLDVDHFKQVNDQFGHHIGDEVLQGIAEALRQGVRTTDLVCRWGGEEFLVLLPDADAQNAKLVLDRVLAVMPSRVVSSTHPDLRVLFSAGVAQARSGEDLADWVKRGDEAMYRAKHAGRGRCVA
ncbi:MAG: GGDEF domain-containing protein [Aquabacterium sp.]|uniref:GGDEF domain-containing protein n=1 Tax=Aquabacterium sp. TaxID=1872578 RepID=UPI0012174DA1|nr:GGDEF domain-containing protein [Aquabacterium sp.]TAK94050.1 MAG: GGDEF domain-containing protein [Aquabacterium sp.]